MTLEKVILEKDLEVNVDNKLKFSNYTEIQVNKAHRILHLTKHSYDLLDADSLKRLLVALVRPIHEYSNISWYPMLQKDCILIEGVQRRATKLDP